MKFFHYRRPSLKTLLGVTAAKKRIKKDLGLTTLLKPVRWWPNKKRQIKREIGYESKTGRLIRDGLPKPAVGRFRLERVPIQCGCWAWHESIH